MSRNGSEAIRWRPETCNAFEARLPSHYAAPLSNSATTYSLLHLYNHQDSSFCFFLPSIPDRNREVCATHPLDYQHDSLTPPLVGLVKHRLAQHVSSIKVRHSDGGPFRCFKQ